MINMKKMINMTEVAKGKYLYGIVTVGERGQIVLPVEARKHFNIKPGDKLLVGGDLKKGIAVMKASIMKEVAMKILGVMGETKKESKQEQ